MSLRIDKFWGNVFIPKSRRDEAEPHVVQAPDRQAKDGQTDKERKEKEEDASDNRPQASPESVEKAIRDLKEMDDFAHTGMNIELLKSESGLMVRLFQANGLTVKTMSAEEFLKLRANSIDKPSQSGKILDQKF